MSVRKAFAEMTASERWLLSAEGQYVQASVAAKRSQAWSSWARPGVS